MLAHRHRDWLSDRINVPNGQLVEDEACDVFGQTWPAQRTTGPGRKTVFTWTLLRVVVLVVAVVVVEEADVVLTVVDVAVAVVVEVPVAVEVDVAVVDVCEVDVAEVEVSVVVVPVTVVLEIVVVVSVFVVTVVLDTVVVEVVLVAVEVTSKSSPYRGTSVALSPVRTLDMRITNVRLSIPSCTLFCTS